MGIAARSYHGQPGGCHHYCRQSRVRGCSLVVGVVGPQYPNAHSKGGARHKKCNTCCSLSCCCVAGHHPFDFLLDLLYQNLQPALSLPPPEQQSALALVATMCVCGAAGQEVC